MIKTIEVWTPKQTLPQSLINETKKFSTPHNLRKNEGVGMIVIQNLGCMITDGFVPKHKDWEEVTLMIILRNDTNSWVISENTKPIKLQPPGTLILLDIEHPHSLNTKGGKRSTPGVWIAAIIKEFEQWPSKRKVQMAVNEFFKDYC